MRVAGRVPLGIELLEHRAGGRVEGALGAQRIVRVRSAGEQVLVEPVDELVGWVGEIARHLLLDRPALLRPLLVRVVDAVHAGGLRLQGDVEVGGGHGGKVLRDVLLRIGVVLAAKLGIDGGGLVGRHAGAAAKRHVLLGVGHAGETIGRLIAADQQVGLDGNHGGERVAQDDNLHAVRKVARTASDCSWARAG